MKRIDRHMAILIALQQRSETAQSLADKLEVSIDYITSTSKISDTIVLKR